MGFSVGLSIYLAFRAGRRLRGLTPENFEERVADFAFYHEDLFFLQNIYESLTEQGIASHYYI